MKFDDTALHALATKAILDSMTPEYREQLLARAVAGLFEKNKEGGYPPDNRTKFEAAFDDALGWALRDYMQKLVRTPQFTELIEPLFKAAAEKALMGENRDRLASIFEEAITAGLTKLRGY